MQKESMLVHPSKPKLSLKTQAKYHYYRFCIHTVKMLRIGTRSLRFRYLNSSCCSACSPNNYQKVNSCH